MNGANSSSVSWQRRARSYLIGAAAIAVVVALCAYLAWWPSEPTEASASDPDEAAIAVFMIGGIVILALGVYGAVILVWELVRSLSGRDK